MLKETFNQATLIKDQIEDLDDLLLTLDKATKISFKTENTELVFGITQVDTVASKDDKVSRDIIYIGQKTLEKVVARIKTEKIYLEQKFAEL